MNDSTLLHRQVHPSFVREGRITSQVFKPTPKDKSCLSVYDGDQITAEDAWRYYTSKQNFQSVGVMAVTVAECLSENLKVRSDPNPFPEHVLIDFADALRSPQSAAQKLSKVARQRGWQYQVKP